MQNLDLYLVVGVLMIVCFVLLLSVIGLLISQSKLNKKFRRAFNRNNTPESLEVMLENHYTHIKEIDDRYGLLVQSMDELYSKVRPCMQKVGVVRYNPFENMGGDLSYALAILDEDNNGFVLNTVMTRESSRTYCKPVTNAISDYPLSDEEALSIKKAMNPESVAKGRRTRSNLATE